MENVLDLYALRPNEDRPLVCLDEFCKQLVSEVAAPEPAKAGSKAKPARRARYDSEYVREGSASAFMIAAPHLGRREIYIGEEGRRTAIEYADAIEFLSDVMFPEAEKIILIQDNLNTHCPASLYKRFSPQKARRLASRIEWHYTPKHGSWLNIAEIEISVLSRTALRRRIASLEEFNTAVAANTGKRNQDPSPVRWQFKTCAARTKLRKLYPTL
jgi:hypothetical protein